MHKSKIKIEYVHIYNNLKPNDLTNIYLRMHKQLLMLIFIIIVIIIVVSYLIVN